MGQDVREIFRKDIDTEWWDQQVAASHFKNPMIYSWVLDILADDWSIFTDEDNALPVPFSTKFGLRRARQHPFSRQVDFLNFENQSGIIKQVKKSFAEVDLGISISGDYPLDQVFQWIDLNEPLELSTNARRLVKKSEGFDYVFSEDTNDLVHFFHSNSREKIDLPESHSLLLEKIMKGFLFREKGFYLTAKMDEIVVAGIFIILDKDVAYYLIADGTSEAKKEGVVFGLMKRAIDHARELGYQRFDFGGSNVESVAAFYRKFGASDEKYSRIVQDELPAWFKFVKKLRGA